MQIEASPHARNGATSRPRITFFLAHNFIQLRRHHGTDRSSIFRRDNFRFLQEARVNFESDVSFHGQHEFTCYTILRAIAARVNEE